MPQKEPSIYIHNRKWQLGACVQFSESIASPHHITYLQQSSLGSELQQHEILYTWLCPSVCNQSDEIHFHSSG